MSRPNDHATRLRALTELDRSMLIEAGAGSGKTTLMAGRVASLLANGVPPRNIAAITFTEAAASNLRNAVHALVHQLVEGDVPAPVAEAFSRPLPQQQREHLQHAAAHLGELTSSTIHAFARSLTTPYPIEAAIDPGATMLDPTDADRLFERTRDAWLRERLDSASGEEGGILTRLFLDDPTARKLVDDLTDVARLYPEAVSGGTANVAHARSAFLDAATEFLEAIRRQGFLPDKVRPFQEGMDAVATRVHATGNDAVALGSYLRGDARNSYVFTSAGSVRQYRTKTAWKEGAAALKQSASVSSAAYTVTAAAYDEARRTLEELCSTVADQLLHELLDVAHDGRRAYEHAKRAAALLDPDDLLRNAVHLLRSAPEVRSELQRRYRYILVDEFQDTDPLQAELVWRITGTPSGDDWRTWPSLPGARFIVGDPKQSIYRFRRADVNTYRDLRDRMQADPHGDVLEITTNFRSHPDILHLTNTTFTPHFLGANQPGYEPLTAFLEATDAPAVVWYDPQADAAPPDANDLGSEHDVIADADPTTVERRRDEAHVVANLCAYLLEHRTRADGQPLQQRDIALLSATGTGLDLYEAALERKGLAVASQAGKNYYRQQVIHDLIALTRTLADPDDTLALGALLRGPLVGATDEELLNATHALRTDRFLRDDAPVPSATALRIDTPLDGLDDGIVRATLVMLADLAERAWSTSPFELLHEAIDTLDVYAKLHARNPATARRNIANLERFLDRSHDYAVRGLRAYAHDLRRAWTEQTSESEAAVDTHADAVTLMTIHASKGLEWPVVIPINLFATPTTRIGAIVDRVTNVARVPILGLEPSGYRDAKEREQRAIDEERIRLGYVATTRAKDLLALRHDPNDDENSWIGRIGWAKDHGQLLDVPATPTPPSTERSVAGPDCATFAARTRALAEALPTLARKQPSDHETPDREDAAERASVPRAASPSAGQIRGILTHKLLEELINQETDPTHLAERAAHLLDQQDLRDPTVTIEASHVAATVLDAWNHPAIARFRHDLWAEVTVARTLIQGNHVDLTSGLADAVAIRHGQRSEVALVIDWKSDATLNHLDVYRDQIRVYLDLLDAPLGLLFFTSSGHVEEVPRL